MKTRLTRPLTQALASIAFALVATLSVVNSAAAAGYQTLSPPINTSTGDQVEVLEFFWLGCPHCYALEPKMEAWVENKPEHATFVREAPPLNPSWEPHSRGFYAAQIMGIENEFVHAMFTAIHEDKKRMRKPDDIAELAATLGVDEKKFLSTMKSFAVNTKIGRSMQLAKSAGLTGVPFVMINGKYTTSGSIAGSHEGMIRAIEETVELEHKAAGS
ncbi:MAG: thiol:disulfide interchange protein DsbA/DsbL [Gammaproteobacteria bacterium]|nr:thiol:disulfide interchange protein DsbA/DsbL [Gammaproteobacteria bacterium]